MGDLLAVPELVDTTFAFTDISERNLDIVAPLCRRDIAANKLPASVQATANRRAWRPVRIEAVNWMRPVQTIRVTSSG